MTKTNCIPTCLYPEDLMELIHYVKYQLDTYPSNPPEKRERQSIILERLQQALGANIDNV